MADILIRGVEMPKTCSQCPLCYDYMMCSLRDGRFSHMGESFDCCEMRLADCPLVELPQHGDLIDRDALINVMSLSKDYHAQNCREETLLERFIRHVKEAHVIVPANKEETE